MSFYSRLQIWNSDFTGITLADEVTNSVQTDEVGPYLSPFAFDNQIKSKLPF